MNPKATAPSPTYWPSTILAITCLLVPALGVPNEYVLQDTLKSALAAFGILLAALTWTYDWRKHPSPLHWHWVVLLPAALCLYAVGSMFWSHTYLAAVEAVRWLVVGLVVLLGLNLLTPERLPRLLWGIHTGALVAALIAWAQFMFGVGWFPEVAMPGSTFLNKNFFSEYLCTTLPLSIHWFRQSASRSALWSRGSALALMVTTVLMAGSRAAYVALVPIAALFFGLTLLRVAQAPAWSASRKALGLGIVVLGVAVLGSLPSANPHLAPGTSALGHANTRGATLANPAEYTEGSFSVRVQLWRATARMLLAHPLTGVGAGAWEVEIPLYQAADTSTEIDFYAHNEWLQLLSEYGVVGGLVLAVFGAFLLLRTAQGLRTRDALLLTICMSTWCLLLVGSAGFPLRLAPATLVFGLLLAVLAKCDANHDSWSLIQVKDRPRKWVQSALLIGLLVTLVVTVLAVQVESQLMRATFAVSQARQLQGSARNQQIEIATTLSHDAVQIHPHYRKLTAGLGDLFASVGAWPQAVAMWTSVARSRPHIPALWTYIAIGESELGHHAQAQQALRQLERLMPGAAATRNLELRLASLSGHHAEVSVTLQNLLQSGDFDYERVQLAYVLGYRHHDWPLTLQALTLRAQHWPDTAADAYLRIGRIYQQLGGSDNQQKAQQAFAAGLAMLPALEQERYRQEIGRQGAN